MKLSVVSVFLLALIASTCNAESLRFPDEDIDYFGEPEEEVDFSPEEEHRMLGAVQEANDLLASDKCADFKAMYSKKMAKVLRYSDRTLQGFVCNPINRNGPLKSIEKSVKKIIAKDDDAGRRLTIVVDPCAKAMEIMLALAKKDKGERQLKLKALGKKAAKFGKKQTAKACRAAVKKEVGDMKRRLLEAGEDDRELWVFAVFKAVKIGYSAGRMFGWW